MKNKETFECSNEYLCLKITSKGPCKQQHMVTYASSGVPVPQDKPQKIWGLWAAPGGSETHPRVIPPNATPCLYTTACCPCGWMFKSRNLHPSRVDERLERAAQRKKKSALWYTAPTTWNFNEQKQNPISLLRKQMSLFFSCFNILLAQHHFILVLLL